MCCALRRIRLTAPTPTLPHVADGAHVPACCGRRAVCQVYDAGSGLLALPKSEQAELDALYEELDAASSGWCRAAARLLGELQAGGGGGLVVTHVVVGGSQLVPLLAKLLLFRLDGFFGLQEVYAAAHAPKMAAFKRIATKYGPKAR